MILEPGTQIYERYRVVQQIGQGGMGAVYEAVDERLSQTVALKQKLLSDSELDKAFEREAKILAGLRHPALTRVIDHFTNDQGQFLVMDFVPGEDLATLLQQRGDLFPVDVVMDWADQILDALEYLHSQQPPVIHRDIKPQNLKLTHDGQIVLLDFGLAKGTSALQTHVTGTGSVFGYTPQYAPLEQIEGSGTEIRSDLYALGATLYHLLSNIPPENALKRTRNLLNEQPDSLRPLHEVNAQVPRAVSTIIHNALALQPGRRPAHATAMRADLQATRLVYAADPSMPKPSKTNKSYLPAVAGAGTPPISINQSSQQNATPSASSQSSQTTSIPASLPTAEQLRQKMNTQSQPQPQSIARDDIISTDGLRVLSEKPKPNKHSPSPIKLALIPIVLLLLLAMFFSGSIGNLLSIQSSSKSQEQVSQQSPNLMTGQQIPREVQTALSQDPSVSMVEPTLTPTPSPIATFQFVSPTESSVLVPSLPNTQMETNTVVAYADSYSGDSEMLSIALTETTGVSASLNEEQTPVKAAMIEVPDTPMTIIPTPSLTNTPTPVPASTETPTPTEVVVSMETPLSNTPIATNTPLPTNTNTPAPTATNTNTPIPIATDTNTPVPTATDTNTPAPTTTNTNTPAPTTTNTNTPVPTATPTHTDTPVPTPTNTPTDTPIPQPPVIYSIEPNRAENHKEIEVSIKGEHFEDGTQAVLVKDKDTEIALDVTFLSDSELRGKVPKEIDTGEYNLRVSNLNGQKDVARNIFTVIPPKPKVETVNPSEGYSDEETVVSVGGRDFDEDAEIFLKHKTIGNILVQTTYMNDTLLQGTIPANLNTGRYSVGVRNPDSQPDILIDSYQVIDHPPEIHAIGPVNGENSSETSITINGNYFDEETEAWLVDKNDFRIPLNVSFIGNNKLEGTVPANLKSDVYDVLVKNPDGQDDVLENAYTVLRSTIVVPVDPPTDTSQDPLGGDGEKREPLDSSQDMMSEDEGN